MFPVPLTAGVLFGALVAARTPRGRPARANARRALGVLALASAINLGQAYGLAPSALGAIAPLALYAFGIALAMPAFTLMAIDCFPRHRGSAAAMQGFVQMLVNALVAAVLVPLAGATLGLLALAQLLGLLLALLLWWFADRRPAGWPRRR